MNRLKEKVVIRLARLALKVINWAVKVLYTEDEVREIEKGWME